MILKAVFPAAHLDERHRKQTYHSENDYLVSFSKCVRLKNGWNKGINKHNLIIMKKKRNF